MPDPWEGVQEKKGGVGGGERESSGAMLELPSQVWTYLVNLKLATVQGEFEAAAVVESLSLRASNQQRQLSITGLQASWAFSQKDAPSTRAHTHTHTHAHTPPLDDALQVLLDSVSMGAVHPLTHQRLPRLPS